MLQLFNISRFSFGSFEGSNVLFRYRIQDAHAVYRNLRSAGSQLAPMSRLYFFQVRTE